MQQQAIAQPGEHVSIPKGTEYHKLKGWSFTPDTDEKGTTTRDAVVKVVDIRAIYSDTETVMEDYQVHCGHGDSYKLETRQRQVRKVIGYYVVWADGKYTLESNVTKAEAPVRKERAEPAKREPTLRQRMVKGTKWKLTKDAKLVKKGSSYHELVDDGVIPAGTIVEVVDKFTNYGPGYADGLWVPLAFPGWKSRLVQFSEVNQSPEQVGEAEAIPVFYIFDTATQKYYGGWEFGDYVDKTPEGYRNGWERHPNTITYVEKLSKAKKFNRLADVRAHALIQSGYYADLPGTWGSIPDWMATDKAFDIPDTWEIVKIDKLTKNVIERIELVDTFKRSWSLRELTVKYGSCVRQVYSDLEKKKKLDDYSAMMFFVRKQDNDKYWYDFELTEDEKAEVQEVVDRFEKNEYKIHKSPTGFAMAVKDSSTAVMARLMYSGKLQCGVIDFTTMAEVLADK